MACEIHGVACDIVPPVLLSSAARTDAKRIEFGLYVGRCKEAELEATAQYENAHADIASAELARRARLEAEP